MPSDPGADAGSTAAPSPVASTADYARWERWLKATWPLLGGYLRRRALRALEQRLGDPRSLPLLVAALLGPDPEVAHRAEVALRSLSLPAAVDALCALWADQRSGRLGQIVESCGYTAGQPAEVRVLSCLKAGRVEALVGTAGAQVPVLVAALEDPDPTVRSNAGAVLRRLSDPAAVDVLVDRVLQGAASEQVVRIIEESGHEHSVEGRTFLYLVLVGRIHDYLGADHDFRVLRPEFQAAPADLQARVREAIVHSGNVRMAGLFVAPRRETLLGDLSDADADMLVRVNARNRNWPVLFKSLWVLPARHIARAVTAMAQDRWRPQEPDKAALLARLTTLVAQIGRAPDPVDPGPILGPVLGGWLARGEALGGARGEEEGLEEGCRRVLVEDAHPVRQIEALGALRSLDCLDSSALDTAGHSAHWTVRYVAAALGGRVRAVNAAGALWFQRLARVLAAEAVWGGKPCNLTRQGLEALQQGLAGLENRRAAGGLLLLEAVYAHYTAHDIEVEVGAHVVVGEDSFEIEG